MTPPQRIVLAIVGFLGGLLAAGLVASIVVAAGGWELSVPATIGSEAESEGVGELMRSAPRFWSGPHERGPARARRRPAGVKGSLGGSGAIGVEPGLNRGCTGAPPILFHVIL